MVHVVNLAAGTISRNIIVGTRPRRIAATPDGRELWVTDELSGTVSVVDLATSSVRQEISFSPPGFRDEQVSPVGIALTADGRTAIVALGYANHIAFIDTATRRVTGYVLVGDHALGLGLSPDGDRLYVANDLSDDISVINMSNRRNVLSVMTGRGPHSVVVDN
jgi:YVTN family beta-propeller protein